jgi:hypothetical protein
MNSEKPKQAWCLTCGKRRSIKDMNNVPAIGYMCKKKFKNCKRKEHLLDEVERMRNDPKLKHLFISEEEKLLYQQIDDFKEWLRKREALSNYTHEGVYTDIPIIIKELDKRFPYSHSNAGMRSEINKGGKQNNGRI